MAFRISDMTTKLKSGGARPTLFQVALTAPQGSDNEGVLKDIKDLSPFFIQATSIPSSTISSIDVPYFGRKIKVAGDRTFDTWSVTIINDEDFALRHIFEVWHNSINSLYTNVNLFKSAAPLEYKARADVIQYSKTPQAGGGEGGGGAAGQPLRIYSFDGLFPIDISAIDLDWGTTDTIETFNVTFAYDFYEVIGGRTRTVQQSPRAAQDYIFTVA